MLRLLGLQVQGLRFAFAGAPPLFDDVGFDLAAGQTLCLLGPNGAGKTTLLRCVLGLESPQAGRVRIEGEAVAALSPAQRARRMAYVPQSSAAAFPFTVFDMVLMGRHAHLRFMADPGAADRRIARQALERLQIGPLEARRFHELSGGERQLVLVARALAQQAPVLVMDEPCAGLDLGHQVQVLAALQSLAGEGYALLMSTHLPEQAFALQAQVGLLTGGRLLGPAPAAECLNAAVLSRLYGTAVDLVEITRGPAGGQRTCVPVMTFLHGGAAHDSTASRTRGVGGAAATVAIAADPALGD
jgi:iron complex transport system ATP-binding protein